MAALAGETNARTTGVPVELTATPRAVPVDDVALNPLNTREVSWGSIEELAESIKSIGQLHACAVVNRAAFVAIFPEHEKAIGQAKYVEVTGARRLRAVKHAGLLMLDVSIRDPLAKTRFTFLEATAAENIERKAYDPIEEAHAVQLMVNECPTAKDAAERLRKSPAWVSQRLKLLSLSDAMKSLLRDRKLPIERARELARLPAVAQLPAWEAEVAARIAAGQLPVESPDEVDDDASVPPPRPASIRLTRTESAIQRLGGTPPKVAEALLSKWKPQDLRALVEFIQQRLDS